MPSVDRDSKHAFTLDWRSSLFRDGACAKLIVPVTGVGSAVQGQQEGILAVHGITRDGSRGPTAGVAAMDKTD
jgi:hypothetical protein